MSRGPVVRPSTARRGRRRHAMLSAFRQSAADIDQQPSAPFSPPLVYSFPTDTPPLPPRLPHSADAAATAYHDRRLRAVDVCSASNVAVVKQSDNADRPHSQIQTTSLPPPDLSHSVLVNVHWTDNLSLSPYGHDGKQTFPRTDIYPSETSPPLVLGHLPLSLYIRLAGQDLSQFECDYRDTYSCTVI